MNRFMISPDRNKKTDFFFRRVLSLIIICSSIALVLSCVPKDPVQLRAIRNIVVDMDSLGEPILRGEAVFYNPNHLRMKLREIKMEVLVDGKKSAQVDQKPDLPIPAVGEFTVKVEARLSLKEIGLIDAVVGFFGGKKYDVQYIGYVRVKVHGVTVKIPIKFTDQIKLKM
jgi:LEA14-like dessication related protein